MLYIKTNIYLKSVSFLTKMSLPFRKLHASYILIDGIHNLENVWCVKIWEILTDPIGIDTHRVMVIWKHTECGGDDSAMGCIELENNLSLVKYLVKDQTLPWHFNTITLIIWWRYSVTYTCHALCQDHDDTLVLKQKLSCQLCFHLFT